MEQFFFNDWQGLLRTRIVKGTGLFSLDDVRNRRGSNRV